MSSDRSLMLVTLTGTTSDELKLTFCIELQQQQPFSHFFIASQIILSQRFARHNSQLIIANRTGLIYTHGKKYFSVNSLGY